MASLERSLEAQESELDKIREILRGKSEGYSNQIEEKQRGLAHLSEKIIANNHLLSEEYADTLRESCRKKSRGKVLSSLIELKDNDCIKGLYDRLGNLGVIDDKYNVAITIACPELDNFVVDSVEAEFIPAFYSVLGNTLVAKDLTQASRIAFSETRWRVMILGGVVIEQSDAMSGGGHKVSKSAKSSRFTSEVTSETIAKLEKERDEILKLDIKILKLEMAYAQRYVKISELPSDFRYDMEWPIKKIPLNRTGYGIEDHAEMQVYALATSIPVKFILRDENGYPINDFVYLIVSIPVIYRYDFLQILCIKCVNLQTKSTSSGRKSFIAVYIFEIIEVVPEPDNPQTNHKFKLLCHEEVKGSVTAICDVKEYLLTCIFIRAFEDNDRLISMAFIDIQIYGISVVSVKATYYWEMYTRVFGFLDSRKKPAKLILVADMDKNIHVFQYAPYSVQSFAGQKLIRRGYFHIGGSGFLEEEIYYFVYVELLM
ncbi:13131_t:CDS:10 [Funneliformis caledonium]|uniref:13131_t:CDS:1 n=1 Tax=Funneliformis caledonium TaxID=1117310 RepID=A0A9N9HQR5_9GLOM|nr:13131_t:CDS:10 [Funneliformis caledonium]